MDDNVIYVGEDVVSPQFHYGQLNKPCVGTSGVLAAKWDAFEVEKIAAAKCDLLNI